ncbi:MAG: Cytoplasmic GTPase/eEF2-like protein (ribosomal biogenesis) [Trizodia sp. TS-e1964]|nr:MAG: Cytoplasmic GTPase/eEF2-like protein (ribosomal biogenesis) [Trizodia sp. TS-e1964]
MPVVNSDKLISLQSNADCVRNICILAHVDHGKTSLTDGLLATNGIISAKLAGKIRYLDSRPDEQLRGITMESSAISLYFPLLRRTTSDAPAEQQEYLINLIDSPGHIDFSSEVSTASRLSDGAVVLVDAVEGVCSQTVTVLRLTWTEHLKPLLVINKVDRLITELKMSPSEAYTHLSKLLEQVNAVVGSFFQGERMEEDLKWRERTDKKIAAASAKEQEMSMRSAPNSANGKPTENPESGDSVLLLGEYEEKDDEDIYFAPEKNNVVFSSATDGWAFTVTQFASLYEKRLGMKKSALEKYLWGDYYLDTKTKKVLGKKHLKGRPLKPMFAQLVLEPIWAVYEATKGKGDTQMLEKITKSLSIKLPLHVTRSKGPRVVLAAIFSAWLPLSTALLVSVIEHLPSPRVAQAERLPALIDSSPGAENVDPRIRDAVVSFKTAKDEPVVAFVSKIVAIPESELPGYKKRAKRLSPEEARVLGRKKRAEIALAQDAADDDLQPAANLSDSLGDLKIVDIDSPNPDSDSQEDPEHLIGFARLYSGTLSVGDTIYVVPPKYSPANSELHIPQKTTITALYLLMGRSLEPLNSVPAGVVFGVAGLDGKILKSGTLCSQASGAVNLAGVNMGSQPIVRVALEPENPSDLDKMIEGLKLLEQSDPCARYEVLESGEHVILTAGELHLERCLKDLRERFARCEIQAGESIVPYRETIVGGAEMSEKRDKELPRGTVESSTTSHHVSIRLRVRYLATEVTDFLSKHAPAIKRLYSDRAKDGNSPGAGVGKYEGGFDLDADDAGLRAQAQTLSIAEFREELSKLFQSGGEREIWTNAVEKIAAFGPRRIGPNILIDNTKGNICKKVLHDTSNVANSSNETSASKELTPRDFADTISYAFQLATAQGPLCNEPMQGVAVILEDVSITTAEGEEETPAARENLGRLTGEVIKTVRESIRAGFLDWSPRLLLAMYSCEIQASTEVLGKVYAVLTRRRGRILSESLKEGTPFFTIASLLPVAESFGFSDEIRKRTSGAASPQLIFAGFEMLNEDPFWVPFTEEDLEDLGELADKENVAKRYMDKVRKRKGLPVTGKKLVKDAEKQKTLKR